MSIGICIIAHSPLASAIRECCRHIYSTTDVGLAERIVCFDVPADMSVEKGTSQAKSLLGELDGCEGVLVFTDLLGATPSNIAHNLSTDPKVCVVAGVNLPAVITALSAAPDTALCRALTISEGAAHAGISSCIGRKQN